MSKKPTKTATPTLITVSATSISSRVNPLRRRKNGTDERFSAVPG